MQWQLIVSIAIRVAALVVSLLLLRRTRHWSMAILALALVFMIVQQAFRAMQIPSELPGLVVSIVAMLGVVYLARLLDAQARASEALRESEALSRAVIDGTADAVFVKDVVGRYQMLNAAAAAVVGTAPAEVIGKDDRDLFTPEAAATIMANDRRVLEAGRAQSFEERTVVGGETRLFQSVKSVLRDRSGRITGLIGVARDMTERHLIEEALRDSEDRFRRMVSTAQEGIWLIDADARMGFVNQRIADLLGYTADELLGHPVLDFIHESSRAEAAQRFADRRTGVADPQDFHFRRKDGSDLWAIVATSPMHDRNGQFVGVLGMITDITERKRMEATLRKAHDDLGHRVEERTAELVAANDRLQREIVERKKGEEALRRAHEELESRVVERTAEFAALNQKLRAEIVERTRTEVALRESEERFRAAFAHAAVGMALTTLEGRFLQVNATYCAITGYSPDELFQRDFRSITHPDDLSDNLRLLRQLLDGSIPSFFIEKRYVKKDGSIVWVRNSVSTTRDAQGRPMNMVALVEDITERKRCDEDLRELSGRIIRLQDEERRRIARELHDSTAQGLAAVSINLTLLKKSAAALDENTQRAIDESLAMTEQATREIRTLSYLLHPPLLDEAGLPSAIRWYADGFTKRSGIEIALDVPTDLGRMPVDVETTIFRVVQEALTNVHRHSGSRSAGIRVARDESGVVLEVWDEGSGIVPKSPVCSSDGIAGLGVGIAGMRERARQLGGVLDIVSSNTGTTVQMRLPLEGSKT
ncbi:MAG: PAS domain S-box protein [Planctomycetes bacterium]|nr:PAS domain S-box protein [Planctomycetota bacterium]